MAVKYIEGFDHISASQIGAKGWNCNGGSPSMVSGRWGGQALRGNSVSSGFPTIWTTFGGAYTEFTVGFAWMFGTATVTAVPVHYLTANDASNIVYASMYSSGSGWVLRLYNNGGTVLATGTTVFSNNVWYQLEYKVTVNSSTGSVALRINGVDECSASNVNTGSSGLSGLTLRGPFAQAGVTNWYVYADDVFVNDTSTSPNTSWLGDCRVQTLWPTADGTTVQWTPLSSTNESNIDDTTSYDSDTTYNSTSSGGNIDTFTFDDLTAATSAVYGVRVNAIVRKDDADTREVATVIRQGSTNYAGTTGGVSETYSAQSQTYAQDPTGSDWTVSNVNSNEYGYKLVT